MKTKNLYALLLCSIICLNVTAQEEDSTARKRGFKKENLFTGGSVTLAFSNGTTVLGLSPYFGYSLNKYIDVAASINFNYISQRDFRFNGDKLRQTTYAPGAFIRLFPVKFLFAHALYEHHFIRQKYIPDQNNNYPAYMERYENNSVLVGAGYAGGREEGNNTYYYISLSFDVAKGKNSPYKDEQDRVLPVIRAGYNIALFNGRRR